MSRECGTHHKNVCKDTLDLLDPNNNANSQQDKVWSSWFPLAWVTKKIACYVALWS